MNINLGNFEAHKAETAQAIRQILLDRLPITEWQACLTDVQRQMGECAQVAIRSAEVGNGNGSE